MKISELWHLSAKDITLGLRAGDFSCKDVTRDHLDRLERINPMINAVTEILEEEALATALSIDKRLAKGADESASLLGVPFTIKQNIDQKGTSLNDGIEVFADRVSQEDAPVIANLRRAGAVFIGRTNCPEFSLRWDTDNTLFGPTLNPWNDQISSGGSSGGAAAAVVCGIGAVAHGNDLGGSLRYPAYCCGCCSIKPTAWKTPSFSPSYAPEEKTIAVDLMAVQGPIARTVNDVRLALEAMSQSDLRDPWHLPDVRGWPHLTGPLPVAVTTEGFGAPLAPSVLEAVENAARILENAGYSPIKTSVPSATELADGWRSLIGVELFEMKFDRIREHGSAQINQVVDSFLSGAPRLDIRGLLHLLQKRTKWLREWLDFTTRYPVVIAPVSLQSPMDRSADLHSGSRFENLFTTQIPLVMVNMLGLPAVSVPMGVVDDVPVGVQIIGWRFQESLCLEVAEIIERSVGPLYEQLWAKMSTH